MKLRSIIFGAIGALGLVTAAAAGYWTVGQPALTSQAFIPADSGYSGGTPPQSGYLAEAWGTDSITGTEDKTTGLNTVVACTGSLQEDAALTGLFVTFTIPTQSGSTAGHVTIKVWKPTASGDTTPIAATAAKKVGFHCIGT